MKEPLVIGELLTPPAAPTAEIGGLLKSTSILAARGQYEEAKTTLEAALHGWTQHEALLKSQSGQEEENSQPSNGEDGGEVANDTARDWNELPTRKTVSFAPQSVATKKLASSGSVPTSAHMRSSSTSNQVKMAYRSMGAISLPSTLLEADEDGLDDDAFDERGGSYGYLSQDEEDDDDLEDALSPLPMEVERELRALFQASKTSIGLFFCCQYALIAINFGRDSLAAALMDLARPEAVALFPVLGPHPNLAITHSICGSVALNRGNPSVAAEEWTTAVTMREALFGKRHPDTVAAWNNLGAAKFKAGDAAGAREALLEAVSAARPEWPRHRTVLGNLELVKAAPVKLWKEPAANGAGSAPPAPYARSDIGTVLWNATRDGGRLVRVADDWMVGKWSTSKRKG